MATPSFDLRRSVPACVFFLLSRSIAVDAASIHEASGPCQLYIAESTIPNAGLGVFAGTPFEEGEAIGRVGDAAFPVVDQDWHNSPEGGSQSKSDADYHWPLTNYDWNAPDIGMENEGESVSVTVTGFGAAPNCHFRLLNVLEHHATYDNAGLDRYTSPGAGASTPWFNRTSTAAKDIEAGSELFVDYGHNWFLSRDDAFGLVPVGTSFENAQAFLKEYGKLLVGSDNPRDLVEDKMALDDDAQRDLWDIIKTFPYPTRERQALPDHHQHAVRAIHGDIQAIEKESSVRPLEDLRDRGRCVDNIVPGASEIPHAGRGAFATRRVPKGGLVAPAPLVHVADEAAAHMYGERIGGKGNLVRDEAAKANDQIIVNYMFGHRDSAVLLFPYSSAVAYVNHHQTDYNAELRWATDAPWIHHADWLEEPVSFLEKQWSSGLMLEFIALRDIEPGEEVLIDYGDEWQEAWDEHLKKWEPMSPESDYNNLTMWSEPSEKNQGKTGYIRAEVLNKDRVAPLRTMEEQTADPYPRSIQMVCRVNPNHRSAYLFQPETIPFFVRNWEEMLDMNSEEEEEHVHKCNVTQRYKRVFEGSEDEEEGEENEESEHKYLYTVELGVKKQFGDQGDQGAIAEAHEIENVPWHAISFVNMHYTSDIFLKNSFRHAMMLPDHIFPKAWMRDEQK